MDNSVQMLAVVGSGGLIGATDALPCFLDTAQRDSYRDWFMETTKGGIIVLGHRSMDLLYEAGFQGLPEAWMVVGWTRDATYDTDSFLSTLLSTGKNVYICGGRDTFEAFAPYYNHIEIRRANLARIGSDYNTLPDLFGRPA